MTAPAAAAPNSTRWFTCCVVEAAGAVAQAAFLALALAVSAPASAADSAMLARDVAAFEKAAPGGEQEKALRARLEAGFRASRGRTAPDAAVAHEGRAEAAVQMAKSPADFLLAAKEFEKAIQAAPWVAAYHYNRGVVLEKAEKYAAAARSLELYLLAEPNAKDAREVKKKIAGLRFKQELAARPQAAPQPQQAKPTAPALSGAWQVRTWWGDFYQRPTLAGRWSANAEGTAQVSVAGSRFYATSRHNSRFTMVLDGVIAERRVSGTAVLQGPPACPGMTNQFGFEATVEPDGRRVLVEVKGTITSTFPGGREVCTFDARARSLSILLSR